MDSQHQIIPNSAQLGKYCLFGPFFISWPFSPKNGNKKSENSPKEDKRRHFQTKQLSKMIHSVENPNFNTIWGISFRAICDQKRPKNGLKRQKNGKRRHFQATILASMNSHFIWDENFSLDTPNFFLDTQNRKGLRGFTVLHCALADVCLVVQVIPF